MEAEIHDEPSTGNSQSDCILNISQSDTLPTTSSTKNNSTEILIYCQNFNRMKSPAKMKETQNDMLASTFQVILATETIWDKSVRSEDFFGSNFNVFRDDRNFQASQKKSGGGVLVALPANYNSEIISAIKFERI